MAHASQGQASDPRPLSPHLSIYTRKINMLMSIIHRATGIALYAGTLILAWWLIAAATSPDYFAYVSGLLGSLPGRIVLIGYTWALLHHMFGGWRHFVWDFGRGFDLSSVDVMCWLTLFASLFSTAVLWLLFGF